YDVRRRELRIYDEVEVRAERRMVVRADGTRQVQPVPDAELLLHVVAHRVVLAVALVTRAALSEIHECHGRRAETDSGGTQQLPLVRGHLRAERGDGLD